MPRPPGLLSISSIRALPECVRELGDLYTVSLECDRCDHSTAIYPGPNRYAPGLRIPAMLRGHSCRNCGAPYSHLVLSLAGRGTPFHEHNKSSEWVLDREGKWAERRGRFWEDFDYAAAARKNKASKSEQERLCTKRVRDLEGDEVLIFTCGAFVRGRRCRHARMLIPQKLLHVGVKMDDRLSDLAGRARCERCKQRSPQTIIEIQKGRR